MKLNFPLVSPLFFFTVGLFLIVVEVQGTRAHEKRLSHSHHSRNLKSISRLLPPLYPPHVRSSNSLQPLKKREIQEENSEKIVPGEPFGEHLSLIVKNARRIRSAGFIPPLFPPSEGRGKRNARFIPPLFPPSALKRKQRSADDNLIPPLFPPHGSRERPVRSLNQHLDAALIPPLFPPSQGKRHAKRAFNTLTMASPFEQHWSRIVSVPSLPLSARARLLERQRRSLDAAVIPPLFPPSVGVVRRRISRHADNPSRQFPSAQQSYFGRLEYEKGRQESAAEMSSKLSMWSISIATASLALVAFVVAVTFIRLTRCSTSKEHLGDSIKLPV